MQRQVSGRVFAPGCCGVRTFGLRGLQSVVTDVMRQRAQLSCSRQHSEGVFFAMDQGGRAVVKCIAGHANMRSTPHRAATWPFDQKKTMLESLREVLLSYHVGSCSVQSCMPSLIQSL